MAKISDIDWESNPKDFLDPNETKELAKDFTSGNLSTSADDVSKQVKKEMDKGLSLNALNIDGRAPLNEVAEEIIIRLNKTSEDLCNIGNTIIAEGNAHTTKEVDTYYTEVMEEYNKRKKTLREIVDKYNNHRTIHVKGDPGEEDDKTVVLSRIKLINGENDDYRRVIISGGLDSRSIYYSAVKDALSNVEAMYPKPETANKYRAMWGSLPANSTTSTHTSEDADAWTSYEDAYASGFTIMTPEEFDKQKPAGYATYQDYLKDMYDKYVVHNKETFKYQPEIKNGLIDTRLCNNNKKDYDDTIKYDGEYVEYRTENGVLVRAPLAIAKYENGKIVYVPMTAQQKKAYLNGLTQYYNDIIKTRNSYSDKFAKEISKRTDSTTIVYIDPDSRDQIEAAEHSAAYCQRTGKNSNHSNLVIYSDRFMDLEDMGSRCNRQSSYNYMLEAYTHENGHAYANNRKYFDDRDTSDTWQSIYTQLENDDVNREILRDYSFSTKKELFADATAYYYHDPNRIKQVELNMTIDGHKYETLYDYMDYVLN